MGTFIKIQFITCRDVQSQFNKGKTWVYAQIKQGLLPPSIHISANSAMWIQNEIDLVKAAIIAGHNGDEIRTLVATLVENRKKSIERVNPGV